MIAQVFMSLDTILNHNLDPELDVSVSTQLTDQLRQGFAVNQTRTFTGEIIIEAAPVVCTYQPKWAPVPMKVLSQPGICAYQ